VRARLPQHEDELDVILHNTVWLVGFAEDRGTRVGLVLGICDLVPNYRREIVEPDFSAPDSNVGMQGKDHMATELTTREAYVSDDADQAASRNQDSIDFPPHFAEFVVKLFIVLNKAKLALARRVFLQNPVWGRGHREVQ